MSRIRSTLLAGAAALAVAAVAVGASPPRLEVELDPDGRSPGEDAVVSVVGLPSAALAALGEAARGAGGLGSWADWFSLHVGEASRPPIAARYAIVGDRLELTPRFPLEPGLAYVARFRGGELGRRLGKARAAAGLGEVDLSERFELARPAVAASTTVTAVYPSAATVPENLLKFYLHFSAPMTRGRAYRHVRIVDAAGREVELAFVELEHELWDPEGRRLTLLFDPGRLKAGLVPRREVGPALAGGFDYALEVDAAWPDAAGNPLLASFRHPFRVTARDDLQPDPDRWRWQPPRAHSRDPLVIDLGEPLDQALLLHSIWVVALEGDGTRAIAGRVEVAEDERVWRFVPGEPWSAGAHELRVDPLLEDLAGNSVARPFEVDLRAASPASRSAPRVGVWRQRFVPTSAPAPPEG